MCLLSTKLSDVSNGARPRAVHAEWGRRVCQEFYAQGDKEREAGLPISSYMDRKHPKEVQCQSSFLEYIVAPLFTLGKRLWPEMEAPTRQLQLNKEALVEAAVAQGAEA